MQLSSFTYASKHVKSLAPVLITDHSKCLWGFFFLNSSKYRADKNMIPVQTAIDSRRSGILTSNGDLALHKVSLHMGKTCKTWIHISVPPKFGMSVQEARQEQSMFAFNMVTEQGMNWAGPSFPLDASAVTNRLYSSVPSISLSFFLNIHVSQEQVHFVRGMVFMRCIFRHVHT